MGEIIKATVRDERGIPVWEYEVRKDWTYRGRRCVILWVRDHYCAYVETKLKGIEYTHNFGDYDTSPDSNIECHGGVTFSGKLEGLQDDNWYFGMDFAHFGDYLPNVCLSSYTGKKWKLQEVVEEAERMCDSIIEYEEKFDKIKLLHEQYRQKINEILSK